MKVLFIITLILVSLLTIAYIVDRIILRIYCKPGFGSYEDKWTSLKAEKFHNFLSSACFVFIVLTTILGIFITL